MQRPYDGSADRPAALVLSPEAPYPTIGGGALRTASLLEYLSPRYDVDLLVFREPGARDPRAAVPHGRLRDVHVLELPEHRKDYAARVARNLLRLILGRPPLNDRFAGFGSRIRAVLSGRRYRLALIEHFWCAPYLADLAPHAERVVLDLHNIESELHRQLAGTEPLAMRPVFRRFAGCCRRMEQAWLPRFSLLLAASEQDAARLRAIAPKTPVAVYPNAIPLVPQPRCAENEVVAFSGNLEYQPNLSAVRFFRREIWPLLRARRPGLFWRLIGKNPQAVAKYLEGDPRIELVGPVPDAVEALAEASVVVVPLLAASGTRFKILEAWAAGRAVVSTHVGAEGLNARDGEHLVLADDPESFARAVLELLDAPEKRAALGRAGRILYEQQYSWPAAWRHLSAAGL